MRLSDRHPSTVSIGFDFDKSQPDSTGRSIDPVVRCFERLPVYRRVAGGRGIDFCTGVFCLFTGHALACGASRRARGRALESLNRVTKQIDLSLPIAVLGTGVTMPKGLAGLEVNGITDIVIDCVINVVMNIVVNAVINVVINVVVNVVINVVTKAILALRRAPRNGVVS